jgi:hypothetical protein
MRATRHEELRATARSALFSLMRFAGLLRACGGKTEGRERRMATDCLGGIQLRNRFVLDKFALSILRAALDAACPSAFAKENLED